MSESALLSRTRVQLVILSVEKMCLTTIISEVMTIRYTMAHEYCVEQ
jgi:hypothetical protein